METRNKITEEKLMKAIIFLSFILLSGISFINAQENFKINQTLSKTQLNKVEEATKLYWKWDKDEEPIKAIQLLEKISNQDPNNWVAPYWAAYISTQLINSDKKYAGYLKKAQTFMDKSSSAFAKKPDKKARPYFHALQSLIYRFQSFKYAALKDKENFDIYKEKSVQELNKGIRMSPNNPVLMVLTATEMGSNPKGNFRKIIASIALLEKAKSEFKKIDNRSPADITYWNEHWIKFWLKRLKPPKQKTT